MIETCFVGLVVFSNYCPRTKSVTIKSLNRQEITRTQRFCPCNYYNTNQIYTYFLSRSSDIQSHWSTGLVHANTNSRWTVETYSMGLLLSCNHCLRTKSVNRNGVTNVLMEQVMMATMRICL